MTFILVRLTILKAWNVYRRALSMMGATPTGSNPFDCLIGYKHWNPSDSESKEHIITINGKHQLRP